MSLETGIRTELISSEVIASKISSQTTPMYVGFAPVHHLVDYANVVNKPILVYSFDDALFKIGYTDDWSYTLSEPIYAHFRNKDTIISPIILLNVLDPDTMASEETTKTVKFENSVGIIEDAKHIINKTIKIDSLKNNEDFIVDYSLDGNKITITDLSSTLEGDEEVRYKTIKTEMMTKDVIIGSTDALGNRKGLEAVRYAYTDLIKVPSLLLCPGYSKEPTVRQAMLKQITPFADHFRIFMYTDIPTDSSVNTYKKAITWKYTNNYTSSLEKPQYPKAINGDKIFHISVLRAVEDQILTTQNQIPVKPASNRPIPAQMTVLDDGTPVRIEYNDALELDNNGIGTATYFEGSLRTWGVNTGLYDPKKADKIDAREQEETTVRSVQAITNEFIRMNFDKLHERLTPGAAQNITTQFQSRLDSLRQSDLILYGKIIFNEDKNTLDTLQKGQFYFDIQVTSGKVIKLIDATIQWTPKGFVTFFGGEV